jgi:hypothetical protein
MTYSAGVTVRTLEERQARPPQPGDVSPCLIEASAPLERSSEDHLAECRSRGIQVVIDRPERPVFVETPEASFYDLIDACVSLLIRDATDASTLVLRIGETETKIEYELRNRGYGMSSNILLKGLSEVDDGSLLDLTRIRRALPDAEAAGAEFTINSEVGEGICIELSMPKAL